jgi:hypothetical protein
LGVGVSPRVAPPGPTRVGPTWLPYVGVWAWGGG